MSKLPSDMEKALNTKEIETANLKQIYKAIIQNNYKHWRDLYNSKY